MPASRPDPYAGYNFEVSVNGKPGGTDLKGSFSEVSGLEVAVAAIDYRVGSEENRVRKIQGLKKFTNITLKKGMTGDLDFWQWIVAGMNGLADRKMYYERAKTVLGAAAPRSAPAKRESSGVGESTPQTRAATKKPPKARAARSGKR